jgi:hypothetical protein
LRKKQEKFGEKVELRKYRNYEKKLSFVRMICDKCKAKSIGGLQHLGSQCFRFLEEGWLKNKEI